MVPFRHSKLTEMFQNYFVGDGRAVSSVRFHVRPRLPRLILALSSLEQVMMIHVNPFDTGFDENAHVMQFSALTREVITVSHAPAAPPPSTRFFKKPELFSNSSSDSVHKVPSSFSTTSSVPAPPASKPTAVIPTHRTAAALSGGKQPAPHIPVKAAATATAPAAPATRNAVAAAAAGNVLPPTTSGSSLATVLEDISPRMSGMSEVDRAAVEEELRVVRGGSLLRFCFENP